MHLFWLPYAGQESGQIWSYNLEQDMYSKWKQNVSLWFNILCSVNVCVSSVAWTVKAEYPSLARAVHVWKENLTAFYVPSYRETFYHFQLNIEGNEPTCKRSSMQMQDSNILIFYMGFLRWCSRIWFQCSEMLMSSTIMFLKLPGCYIPTATDN